MRHDNLNILASTFVGTATAIQQAEDLATKVLLGTVTAVCSGVFLKLMSWAWAKLTQKR
jgi:uncharacterized membrane protein YeiH